MFTASATAQPNTAGMYQQGNLRAPLLSPSHNSSQTEHNNVQNLTAMIGDFFEDPAGGLCK
jgi:hypothetical protein